MLRYGTESPPLYTLDRITIPVGIYHGGRDLMATYKDVTRLMSDLGPVPVKDVVYLPYYNHLDFVWGLNVASEVYAKVLRFFETVIS
ncbi:unnamed protein product [Protopolystoma xenopodis]|uniref:Peptidase S9 prolyl oligopeptidase catalytic domain-containing protein n=1 Tax=Protopolystoma xenopodis TaxID=117903 RepID=A0A448XLX1_9PLAT|nr:unnamed protein product [Protopolystoma xenopodis]